MNAKDFGAFLARTRKACGLTQADLAAQLHVTDKAVSRWGEWDAVLTNSLDLLSPGVRLVKFALDYFFFFCCGLTVPFCEFLLIVMN